MIEVGIALVAAAALVLSAVVCYTSQSMFGWIALTVLVVATLVITFVAPASAVPIGLLVVIGIPAFAWWFSNLGRRLWTATVRTSIRDTSIMGGAAWLLAVLVGFGGHAWMTTKPGSQPFHTTAIWGVVVIAVVGIVCCGACSVFVLIRESASELQRTANLAKKHARAEQQRQRAEALRKGQEARRVAQQQRRKEP